MSARDVIGGLRLTPMVWGRCFSIATAGVESGWEVLEDLGGAAEANSLRMLEQLTSERATAHRRLLTSDRSDRPVGPYASLILDAMSMPALRKQFNDPTLSGWCCYAREQDAIDAATKRLEGFFETSESRNLPVRLKLYAGKLVGRFADWKDLARWAPSDAANESRSPSHSVSALLRECGADGFVFANMGSARQSVIVTRGSAISQLREMKELLASHDGSQTIIQPASVELLDSVDPTSSTQNDIRER
jgi:hypothetical protein